MNPFHSIATEDNLFAATPWNDRGYVVAPFLDEAPTSRLRAGIERLICDYLAEFGTSGLANFRLDRYHNFIDDNHLRLIEKIRSFLPIDRFPIPASLVTDRVSEILGVPVTLIHPTYGVEVFSIRIVRPFCRDHNPLHRDVWLDRLRNAVNLYVPLAGSNELSSLPLAPGSHLWSEDEVVRTPEGYTEGELRYSVPALLSSVRELNLVRPNPAANEVLLFSPYLIHGGASNSAPDQTRVSLEMRFWRKG